MDFDFVTGRLATGAGLSSALDVEALVAAGVTAVVDARAEFDDGVLMAAHPGLLYLWNPTQDDGQPKGVDYWAKTLAFAMPVIAQPRTKLYLHCAAGVNRGPSNCFCVMVALGWDPDVALKLIHARRPVTANGVAYHVDALAAVHQLGYW